MLSIVDYLTRFNRMCLFQVWPNTKDVKYNIKTLRQGRSMLGRLKNGRVLLRFHLYLQVIVILLSYEVL